MKQAGNEAGWVATVSGKAGLAVPISPTSSLVLESGIRWTGEQDRMAVASAAGLSEDSSGLSVLITLRVASASRSLYAQCLTSGAEHIICPARYDRSGRAIPRRVEIGRPLRWLHIQFERWRSH